MLVFITTIVDQRINMGLSGHSAISLTPVIFPRITGHQVKNYIMIQNEVCYEKQSKKKVLNRVSRKTGRIKVLNRILKIVNMS
jgi:hypothetical protein